MSLGGKAGYVPLQGPQAAAPPGQAAGPGYTALAIGSPSGEREWKDPWYCCFGDCDSVGWGVCCATTWCYPCVFGFVKHRAFGNMCKAVAWTVYYTTMAVLLLILRNELAVIESNMALEKSMSGEADRSSQHSFILYYALLWVVVIAILTPGIHNRMAMRKKFDIPHKVPGAAGWDDCCLWFWCNGPALCQETRTIIHNNVEDGVWKGPDMMVMDPEYMSTATAETAPILPYGPPQRGAMVVPMTADATDNA